VINNGVGQNNSININPSCQILLKVQKISRKPPEQDLFCSKIKAILSTSQCKVEVEKSAYCF